MLYLQISQIYHTMRKYSIFIASSMKNSMRGNVKSIIESVNGTLERFGADIRYELQMYSETPMNDIKQNTQSDVIDPEAVKSDLFILLADNNTTIGKLTIEEYEKAHEQSVKANSRTPFIKAFVLTENENEDIILKYKKNDDSEGNFENRLLHDSKRYLQCISKSKFESFFRSWLEKIASIGIDNTITQNELSYGALLIRNRQDWVRKSDNRYYRRENLDGKIEEILQWSPIVILEGNTYSGKSRAAFELMKRNKEWEKSEFHIFCSKNSFEQLNRIRLDFTSGNNGDVYLLDDINDTIGNNKVKSGHSLWDNLIVTDKKKGLTKEQFGQTRIIITVSGQLRREEKMALYKNIFQITDFGADFETFLNSIIVDFDIYDKVSFRDMVDEMKRNGELLGNIELGNYTIGSLFIKEEDLKAKVKSLYQDEFNGTTLETMLKTIAGHYKYAKNSSFIGSIDEIKELYGYFKGETFDNDIEKLRKQGLLVKSSDKKSIHIDSVVINKINEVVMEGMQNDASMLNKSLLDYSLSAKDNNHVFSVAHMGYLLCDRNDLPDDEILMIIDMVTAKVLGDEFLDNEDLENDNDRRILNLISTSNKGRSNMVFCQTAIARLQDFESAGKHIDSCIAYINDKETDDKSKGDAIKLYKGIVYAMFSKNNRIMTMQEEQTMLSHIFDKDKSWKAPFCEDDIKDIFNLEHVTPFMSLTANKIIGYLPNATLDGNDISQKKEEKKGRFTVVKHADNLFDRNLYERVFIPRVRAVVLTALSMISSYGEFEDIKKQIEYEMQNCAHLKEAIRRINYKFYKNIPNIAKQLTFEDRKKFFDFIFSIESDKKTIFGKENLEYDFKMYRIFALNQLLELLDEYDALGSYQAMISSGLYDLRTLSHLFKNEFLNFEQLLPLVVEEQKNFITLNQLMNRATTKSDALTCIRKIGIKDANPAKLRDERALSQYINTKGVNRNECIKIIREWHKLYSDSRLSEMALIQFIKKLHIKDVMDILNPADTSINYMEAYGLSNEDINLIRNDAASYKIFIYRANEHEEYKDTVNDMFKKLMKERKHLVINPESNKNNSILSVYIKNKWLFNGYEEIKNVIDGLEAEYDIWRKDNFVYGPIAWSAMNSKNLDLLNEILKDAYNYFAQYYTREEVEEMMAKLYHYIPRCIDGDISKCTQSISIAYEGEIKAWDGFKSYIQHIRKDNPKYVDSTFIYNTLSKMTGEIDEDIYEILKDFAKYNRIGIKFETAGYLPEMIRKRLFWVDKKNGGITVDSTFIINISRIKMLWHILKERLLNVEQVENYRNTNNIGITQTYLNMVFKAIEKENKAFEKMIEFLKHDDKKEHMLDRSVQMCISFVKVAPSEDKLDEIFSEHGFGELRNRTEVISARMNKILNLRYKKESCNTLEEFKNEIKNNKNEINISIINVCLHALLMIRLEDLKDMQFTPEDAKSVLDDCWQDVKTDKIIDVCKLLKLESEDAEWKIDADAQTISYFVEQCEDKSILRKIDEWFNGDFFYDDEKKKNCLADAIKNYGRLVYNSIGHDKDEVNYIVNEILLADRNRESLKDLCNRYVIYSRSRKVKILNKKLKPFWHDALKCPEFYNYLKNSGIKILLKQ